MIKRPYLNDAAFLKKLDMTTIKETFVKILLLDMNELPIKEIQGQVSAGQITIDGTSSVRRTGNLTFLPFEKEGNLTDINNTISIDKRVKIEIGITNTLNEYKQFPIIWFPLGVYILTDVSINEGLDGTSISMTIQDKMCMLNGTLGGVFPAAVRLHKDADGALVPIYQIIQELVSHYGGEDFGRIYINDVPAEIKSQMQWAGNEDIFISKGSSDDYEYIASTTATPGAELVSPGDSFGYRYTPFTYVGELIATAGQSVTEILDTIKNTLGNYEYFYDLDGNFIFQEIRNALNTAPSAIAIEELNSKPLYSNITINDFIYDFNNSNLITSYTNAPKYGDIKNDFIIWGKKNNTSIRYHLVFDEKPAPTNGDWRETLYLQGKEAMPNGLAFNPYYLELENEWRNLYTEEGEWNFTDPSTINYFLDFVDSNSIKNTLSIGKIGRRTKVVTDDAVNCIFAPIIPNRIMILSTDDQELLKNRKEDYIVFEEGLEQNLTLGQSYKSAFSVAMDLAYLHSSYNSSISLQTIPIYYLDVNRRITVYDENSGINGNYLITSISVPLSISETMSISATEALEKI